MTKKDNKYYVQSLEACFQEIMPIHKKTGKALNDIVGKSYEDHRKRLYHHFGFSVNKEWIGGVFNADQVIRNKSGDVLAIEEDKAHYVDACFLQRALSNYAQVAMYYLSRGEECPWLILSSSTRYKLFDRKLDEFLSTYEFDGPSRLVSCLREKLKYFHVANHDRCRKGTWVRHKKNPISITPDVAENISKEVRFMKRLAASQV